MMETGSYIVANCYADKILLKCGTITGITSRDHRASQLLSKRVVHYRGRLQYNAQVPRGYTYT